MRYSYEEMHALSINDPERFWAAEAEKLHWFKRWDKVLDDSRSPFFRWFSGGETNLCYNAVDRHALGPRGEKPAIIWESPETGGSRTITFRELYGLVNRCAAVLKSRGVKRGDRVLIYMPMVPEALVAVLACARIGAIHSVVFAGFSYESLADRINDSSPKLVICADGGVRKGKAIPLKQIVDRALAAAQVEVPHVIVLDRGLGKGWRTDRRRDLSWEEELERVGPAQVEPERMLSTDPSYILYTSGTTAKPKGVVRDTGGYMVALHASMWQIYGCGPDDIYWSTSDIGWVVGHSYIIYGPLLFGIPTVVFEGTPDSPNPGIWWEVVEKHKVTVIFSAPTAMRMLRKFPSQWIEEHDLSSLRHIFLAGEPLDEPTYHWAREALQKPIIDHYWQTESGWPMITNHMGLETLPVKPGSPTREAMGWHLEVVDERGEPLPAGTRGYLVARPPLPPGALMTIWGDDEKYLESYWTRFKQHGKLLYLTGDYAIKDEDGYFWLLGRADEVINVAGHRLGTREVEEVVSSHPQVAEVSAIGVADEVKGEALAVFVVLKKGVDESEGLRQEVIGLIREKIGAIAAPKILKIVPQLPKTRSGKVMRRVLRALCEERELGDISTIEDGASVEEIRRGLEAMGHKV
ncbi:MAG: acetate--CoA ligase [Candidatus Acetothermia bacterium]|nr:acetate--CoA ligase [Candidatus Acetothermia bacterium]MDH7505370.1 acetate--CoA ligase [Candidatus Acetothermia bacterium]